MIKTDLCASEPGSSAPVRGSWLNEDDAPHGPRADGAVCTVMSSGSSWSTIEQRRANGWAEALPPTNLFALAELQPASFEAEVEVSPTSHGEQAGLYAWTSSETWVKFVIEGARGGGAVLLFAEQLHGRPFVRGKLALPSYPGRARLRLEVCTGAWRVRADWRLADGDWAPMPRGVWVGSSKPSSPRVKTLGACRRATFEGAAEAVCELPEGWRAVLGTEQRGKNGERAIVAFIDVRSCPRPA